MIEVKPARRRFSPAIYAGIVARQHGIRGRDGLRLAKLNGRDRALAKMLEGERT